MRDLSPPFASVSRMSTAAWAVIGVFVGAALQFLANTLSDRRADRRADADRAESRRARLEARQEERAARLFDSRRTAYEAFISTARSESSRLWTAGSRFLIGERSTDLHRPVGDELLDQWGTVGLYGSPATGRAAEEVYAALFEFANLCRRGPKNLEEVAQHYGRVSALLEAFAGAARVDMGAAIPADGGMSAETSTQ